METGLDDYKEQIEHWQENICEITFEDFETYESYKSDKK